MSIEIVRWHTLIVNHNQLKSLLYKSMPLYPNHNCITIRTTFECIQSPNNAALQVSIRSRAYFNWWLSCPTAFAYFFIWENQISSYLQISVFNFFCCMWWKWWHIKIFIISTIFIVCYWILITFPRKYLIYIGLLPSFHSPFGNFL